MPYPFRNMAALLAEPPGDFVRVAQAALKPDPRSPDEEIGVKDHTLDPGAEQPLQGLTTIVAPPSL